MTKKTWLKVRDFSREKGLTPAQRLRLAQALKGASAAQAEIILRAAGKALSRASSRVRIGFRAPSPILGPDGLPA